MDPKRTPFLYLDNGSLQLVRHPHCNVAVIRHLVREHSVVLAGPDPKTVIDPISPDELRAEARTIVGEYAAWLERDRALFRRLDQAYLVLTVCRTLFTSATGEVTGKRQAAAWARQELDARWHPLLDQALADRGDPAQPGHLAAPANRLDDMTAFVEYALHSPD